MPAPSRAIRALGSVASLALLAACAPDATTSPALDQAGSASFDRAGYETPGLHRQYGTPQNLGDGMVRTYVVLDAKSGQAPVELGVSLDARALVALPMDAEEHSLVLALPPKSPAPYQFVELDWNPQGHPPIGVYNVPHFDFHFYTISLAERNSIVPSDPQFAAKANNIPTGAYVPPTYVIPGPPTAPPSAAAVPKMGVHWSSVLSPELQNLFGNPAGYQPFTKTFIYGSWNGRYTFYEPMITLGYLQSNPDVTTSIPVPARYAQAGWFPTAYRVTYDAQTKEYLVALTRLVARP
jgi:hypothetical protein